ncbi:MAG: PilZ domain-containing protein [Acidobacteria bacterium]|nr:PilZ domain-containing protein [Acidobacteriota bacterium]
MRPPVLVAGLDGRSLLLEATVLQREGHRVEEVETGRALLGALAEGGHHLVVLGTRIPDVGLPELIRRIRHDPGTRTVSVLALVPASDPVEVDGKVAEAGANAVLRRPLDRARLDAWIAKLLTVPRRVQARVPVHGQVVGTPRSGAAGHFVGLSRNISVNGMLLASPVPLTEYPDVELEVSLAEATPLKALGRVVRDAPEVGWPYLGYGIEFLFVPEESLDSLIELVRRQIAPPPVRAAPAENHDIHSTLRRESWVYEILKPRPHGAAWQVEIRRAPRDAWRPGAGGPFYVVEETSPEGALGQARAFVLRHG